MTFNVLIATIGRPSLQRMLDSLKPQLVESDCLTIVFDGKSEIPAFNLSGFVCKIVQHLEPVALGSWGHAIRNKYCSIMERRDFVLHADDDDVYFPNVFSELRKKCVVPETLYIARMRGPNGYIVPEGPRINEGHIGTPNGIIPYDLNIKGNWEPRVGGDGSFYMQLAKLAKVEYLQTLIYQIRPPEPVGIPKIVHQIWIGPKKRPDIWMDGVKKFAEKFGYEYKLWDDDAVSKLTMINKTWYDKEPTYNGKSDILRYELLDQFGGVYIDADMAVVRPEGLDKLIKGVGNRDCAFGFEVDNQLICGAVTFAVKGSKFIKKCIEVLPTRDMTQLAWISVGPKLITDLVIKYQTQIPLAVYKSTVFYPLRWHGIQDVYLHTKMIFPEDTVMFQYGYSTNNLESKISQT